MKNMFFIAVAMSGMLFFSCVDDKTNKEPQEISAVEADTFNYNVDQFADVKILRYQIPGWEELTLKEQKLVYYLTQAGLAGRDIMWDQNYRHNLKIRAALEKVYNDYS